MAGWKHKNNITKIVGDEKKPVQLESGQVIINKKATAKHLDKLVDINEYGNSYSKSEVTNDGRSGGILKGKPHYDKNGNPTGGIPSIVDGSKKIEVEGEEFVVNKEASEKHWKELSKINQSAGNGVPIGNPNPFDENPEEYSKGGKIEFNANHTPSKYILNYAEKIKTKYPEIWDLGGNIFGNEAYKNLKRVAQRGYWLDSEEWMYIKWRSYVARHKGDFRIEGVIAMLKWVDKVEKGWSYMKNLIQERIDKIEAKKKKMKDGGEVNAEELELRWDKKKNAIQELANNIHKLRYNVTKDLSSENEKEFLTALVISIIDKTGERVGNEESANNGHFGVTGFKKKHISVNGNKVTLKYIGKSGVEHETSFTDEKIANALKKAISKSASDFIFSSSDGFQIKANKINRYLSKYNVSAKDLRGYSANNWIIEKLNSIEAEKEPNKRKKQFNKILSSVAEKIGHGRATLKKHYLVPELENDFVENGKIVNIKEIGGEVMRKGGISNVNDKNGNIKFMEWYVDWYKKISDKINITFSLPNILLPFKEENVVILDLFEKIDQNIDAKQYLKEIVEKADEFSVTIYLEPTPRYKYFLKNIEKRKKISKDYLISYYQKFGFELTPNKNFMKRLPKSNINEIGGELKYHLGGDMKKHLAPNGKPSNLTHEQWHLVRTPEFKEWFGDWEKAYETGNYDNVSKVIDEETKEPLVVYHGTENSFNVFSKYGLTDNGWYGLGFYFTPSKKMAKEWTSWGEKENILECFLNIRKMYDCNKINPFYNNSELYTKKYIKEGFMGSSFTVDKNKYYHEYCVFYPFNRNIKLADGTNTTFDSNNPDIRYKEGGVVTYKQKYNKKYGYDLDESHDLEEISKDTGVSIKGLQQIYNKGVGAFRTNPSSVRPNVKSEEQWAMARVYSAVMGGKTARIDANELKMEDGGEINEQKLGKIGQLTRLSMKPFAFKEKFQFIKDNPEILAGKFFEDGGSTSSDKVFSASSRFRPYETIVFDPPLIGLNGAKLVSYTWAYEMTMQPNWEGELVGKRVSDWTQAEISAETGRGIVHQYTIQLLNGTTKTVSSESVPILLGYVDRSQAKVFGNLATASKTLAKQQMKLAILEAQKKEYDELYSKFEKAPKPVITLAEISDLPTITQKVYQREIEEGKGVSFTYFKMGDVIYSQDNNYNYNEGKYIPSTNPNNTTIEQLTLMWISERVKEAGGVNPRGLYDLKNRVERQKRKVEQMLKTQTMEDGGNTEDFDWMSLLNEIEEDSKRPQEEKEADEKERWFQEKNYSKKWATSYKDAVNKTVKEYLDAKATYDDWGSRQYKQNKGMVYLGGDDIFGEARSIGSINEARRQKVMRGAKMQMDEAIETLKELRLSDEEISNLLENKMANGGSLGQDIEMISTKYLDSIRTQDKSNWNYDLEKSIENEGVLEPVIISYYPQDNVLALTDGHNRLDTAIDLGIEKIPAKLVLRYDNPLGKIKVYNSPNFNPNAKKPSDLGIYEKGGMTNSHEDLERQIMKQQFGHE